MLHFPAGSQLKVPCPLLNPPLQCPSASPMPPLLFLVTCAPLPLSSSFPQPGHYNLHPSPLSPLNLSPSSHGSPPLSLITYSLNPSPRQPLTFVTWVSILSLVTRISPHHIMSQPLSFLVYMYTSTLAQCLACLKLG